MINSIDGRPPFHVRALIKMARLLGYNYGLLRMSADRTCNLCGYSGPFDPSGLYFVRPDALCKKCRSIDRQRLLVLYLEEIGYSTNGKSVLHFAAEKGVMSRLRPSAKRYVNADLFDTNADETWNIEAIESEDAAFDTVICCHVLEHVDAHAALKEIYRVLHPGGQAFIMVPINESLDTTYENPAITRETDRHLHFQQRDHVRILGRDFRDAILDANFSLREYTARMEDAIKYGLVAGERIFIAEKEATAHE